MSLLRSNKKGQLRQWMTIIVVLFILCISALLTYVFWDQFRDSMTSAGLYTGEVQIVGERFDLGFRIWDYVLVFAMIAFVIGVGITSARLASAPAFFIIILIGSVFLALMSYVLSYVFLQIVSVPTIVAIQHLFPRTILIGGNLHWIMLLNIIVGSITLYAKKQKGQFIR